MLGKEETELDCCSSPVVLWALSTRVVAVDNFVDIDCVIVRVWSDLRLCEKLTVGESTEDHPSCLFQRNREIVPEESHDRSSESYFAEIARIEYHFVEAVLGCTVASVGMPPASDY